MFASDSPVTVQVEGQATEILEAKLGLQAELEAVQSRPASAATPAPPLDTAQLEKLEQAVVAAQQELLTEKQLADKSQKELESDLVSTKHRLLIQTFLVKINDVYKNNGQVFQVSGGPASAKSGRKGSMISFTEPRIDRPTEPTDTNVQKMLCCLQCTDI